MPVSKETLDEVVWMRFGRHHDKPCDNPNVLTCALPVCQMANKCALARLRAERKKDDT